jgi:putative hemolysin
MPIGSLLSGLLPEWAEPFQSVLQRTIVPANLLRALDRASSIAGDREFAAELLRELDVRCAVADADLARIPARGALIAVANHPFGLLEGLVVCSELPRVRSDFKIVANSLLAEIPQLAGRIIAVNPFGGEAATRENVQPMRECIAWLQAGGMLVVFPAGEVAHLTWKERPVADPPWHPGVARILRRVKCPAIPMFFEGSNSLSFQLMGQLHPKFRTFSLARELANKQRCQVALTVGGAIPAKLTASFPDPESTTEYLRYRTYLLSHREAESRKIVRKPGSLAPLAAPVPQSAALASEVAALSPSQLLGEQAEYQVWIAAARQIPHTLVEIGRLREVAFRHAGEGSGKALDLDRFDYHYEHLFLWHKEKREIAGAYRLAATPDVLPERGIAGLYTSTLFRYSREFFERLGPSIELGRSFVRVEYQKEYAPLMLLWKGIMRYVELRPECATLFGAASISDDYSRASRNLMVRFLKSRADGALAGLAKARHPYRELAFGQSYLKDASRLIGSIEELALSVADLERDGKGVPVLIRQYLRAGGKLLAFNLDTRFSNVVDALIVADLRTAAPKFMRRGR